MKFDNAVVKSYPGITLLSLLHIVCKFTEKITSSFMYINAGISDLTSFEKDSPYQEFTAKTSINFPDLLKEAQKMKNIIDWNSNDLVFATLPTKNIEKWNQTRLIQRKTSHLKHTTSYKEMQNTINNNVQEINMNIIHIDTSSNFRTPYLHTAVKANVQIKRADTRK